MNSALLSSEKHDWQTPDNLLDLVRKCSSSGLIGYDPCTVDGNPCRAICYSRPDDDGLSTRWWGNGLVYCNPPYSNVSDWVNKATRESVEGAEIIMLVPARPDTRWWHDNIAIGADAVCFWKGRLKFKGAPASAPFPSAIVYWGSRVEVFERVFSPYGWVVRP
jgi:phage N-6-adenine-methyltransferase